MLIFLIVCSRGVAAGTGSEIRFSFDEGVPEELQVDPHTARVTFRRGEVIEGRGSLLCDTRASFEQWHEFLVSTPAIVFEPGKRYSVSFLYRVLNNVDGNFFCLLRTRANGDETSGDHRIFAPWWTGEPGDEGRRKAEFIIPGQGDYLLVVGVQKRAAIVIDQLEIKEISRDEHRRFIPTLRPAKLASRPAGDRIQKHNEKHGIDRVLEESVLIAGASPPDKMRTLPATDDLPAADIVLGTTRPIFAGEYGIRTIGIAPPYAVLERRWTLPSIWEKRFDLFTDQGFILPLEGEVARPEDGHRMCVNAGFWTGIQRNAALALARESDGVLQPGLGGTMAQDAVECFCKSCNDGFREWLRTHYTRRQLRDWGIRDIDEFSVRTYRLRGGRRGEDLLSDLVLREYVRWKHIAHLSRWAEFVGGVKEEGNRNLRGMLVGASPAEGGAANPYVVAAGSLHDFWLIPLAGAVGRRQQDLLEIPLWIGCGVRGMRVWVTGQSVDALREGEGNSPGPEEGAQPAAEALALGALPVFSSAVDSNRSGGRPASGPADGDALAEENLLHGMMLRYRSLYSHRMSYHNVAVVYSIPSSMWSAAAGKTAHYDAFLDACRLLADNNVPYDVLLFDHPLMYPERDRLRQAGKYGAILLPGVSCMSAGQVAMLTEFGSKGRHIYADGPCALFDEDYNPRVHPGIEGVEIRNLRDTGKVLNDLRDLSWVSIPRLGPEVLSSAWRSRGGKMYAVHIARQGGEPEAGPLPSSLRISLRLPADFAPQTSLWITPENPDGVPVEVERESSERLASEIPMPRAYGVLVYGREGYLEKASRELEARRAEDRQQVIRNAAARGSGEISVPDRDDAARSSGKSP